MRREDPLPVKPETWAMIQALVAFDTTSRESNLGLIEWVRDGLAAQGVHCRLTSDASGTKANDRMRDLERRDHAFDVPFTTLQTGVIRGGTAANIVHRDREVHFEFRYLPGVDPDALELEIKAYAEAVLAAEMRSVDPSTGIVFETKAEIPGLDASE